MWYPPQQRAQCYLSRAVNPQFIPKSHGSYIVTFFNDESTIFGLRCSFAWATHVLCKDPEEIFISNHQFGDGDAIAVVVLNARVPLL